jgi:trimeric autotransporter adhesin
MPPIGAKRVAVLNRARRRSPPRSRAPTPRDDASRGYAVGNLWNFNGTIYRALSVSAGAATWEVVPVSASRPLDVIVGAAAAYGTKKLRADYAGPAIRVIRASDSATLDVGFAGDDLDASSLDAFLAATTGKVDIYYDQSGNGLHATQTASANRPPVGLNTIGGVRVVSFPAEIAASTRYFMNIPVGLSVGTRSVSVITVGRAYSATSENLWAVGTGTNSLFVASSGSAVGRSSLTQLGVSERTLLPLHCNAGVHCLVSGASGVTASFNNVSVSLSAVTSATVTGGLICQGTYTNSAPRDDIGALIIYSSALSAADQLTIRAKLTAYHGVVPQSDVSIVDEGDSITFGSFVVDAQNRTTQETDYLADGEIPHLNIGFPGQTLSYFDTNYATRVAPNFATGKTNILRLFAGTNDIANSGATGAATYAKLVALCGKARATGYKIVVGTMLPRAGVSAGVQAEQAAYNALIRANWATIADGIADFQASPIMGTQASASNTALYSDGIHPTKLGQQYLAVIEAPGVERLFPLV